MITRAKLVAESGNLRGTPYIWGAKGEQMLNPDFLAWSRQPVGTRPPAKQASPGGFALDCSGAFGLALVRAGAPKALQYLWEWNTDSYWNTLNPTAAPLPGDAALYGGIAEDDVSHIEMVISVIDGLVVVGGSSGGDSRTTSIQVAETRRACYKMKESHLYRPDFRGFRSVSSILG